MSQGRWLKVKEAAAYSGVSERTLREWLRHGLQHARPLGGCILIRPEWIDEFITQFQVKIDDVEALTDQVIKDL